ncbi:helix-turn-helix domain-containing protein [Paenibacillus sp. YIM B09110]|uniref:helix-turn-helix domain-containing protein n=1 Tax=Paenibacillus sp. YIM B09110 TaxID=3126102 RepID=UPI00301C1400
MDNITGLRKGIIRKRSVFVTLLVSYLAVFLIPVIIGSYGYVRIEQIMIDNAYRSNAAMLEQIKHLMNTRTKEIDYLMRQVAFNPKQQMLMNEGKGPLSARNQYAFIEFMKELSRYSTSNKMIFDFYVYFSESDTILTPTLKTDSKNFYDNIYTYDDMSYEEYKENHLLGKHYKTYSPAQITITKVKEKNIISYEQSLPYGEKNQILGSISILIDDEQIREALQETEGLHNGSIYIMNEQMNVIVGPNQDKAGVPIDELKQRLTSGGKGFLYQTEGEELFVAYTRSDQNGWTYVSAFPKKVVLEQVNTVKKWSIITVLICLLGGLLACVYMTRRHYNPIREVIRMIRGRSGADSPEMNELAFIKDTVDSLFGKEYQLKNKLSQQLPIIRTDFLSRLVRGQVDVRSITEQDIDFMGLKFDSDLFAVLIIDIDDGSQFMTEDNEREWALIRFVMSNLSNEMLHNRSYFLELAKNRVLILVNEGRGPEEANQALREYISELMDLMRNKFKTWITVGVSRWHQGLTGISQCHDEAMLAVSYKMINGSHSVLFYDELQRLDTTTFRYPLDLELQLMNYTKNGDTDNMLRLLDQIYQINFHGSQLTPDMAYFLFMGLLNTLLKTLDALRLDYRTFFPGDGDPTKYIMEVATASQMHERVKNIFFKICEEVRESRTDHNEALYQNVKAFVEKHYADNNLNLTMIADHFNLNPVYVSAFFKKYGGENLNDFTTRVRIDHTKRLLAEELTVNEIAQLVGYSNNMALTKVFKKLEGITPGIYREQIRKNRAADHEN